MVSPQRRKGSDFEREIVSYLKDHGFPFAERAYGAGRPDDRGDIDGIPGWVIEAKNHRTLEFDKWVLEAATEAAAARVKWWAVIAKRRGKPVADAYVVMPLSQFAELLAEDEPKPTYKPGDIVIDTRTGIEWRCLEGGVGLGSGRWEPTYGTA